MRNLTEGEWSGFETFEKAIKSINAKSPKPSTAAAKMKSDSRFGRSQKML
jgi:hypothetical protein